MTRIMSVRNAALVRSAVICAVLVVMADAVIAGVCTAIMNSGDQDRIFSPVAAVALVGCAVAGAGLVVLANGVSNLIEGADFFAPYALGFWDVVVPAVVNLFVGGIVGGVCGFAFLDRVLPGDTFYNLYVGGLFGFGCACSMAIGSIVAWSRLDR
ncbi:hypothetical protein AB0C87_05045 [Actinomadura sp. NPDC048021]|uniref:hypothetical protein n=1 Tax=Actinomadura sp. NPDC048021 TaxID=3155385 RepID=UPI003402656F